MKKLICVSLMVFAGFVDGTEVDGGESGRSLLLSIETDKQSYQSGEAVPLTLSITNRGTDTTWFDKADYYIEVSSERGPVHGEGILEPNVSPPSHYYIQRDGKLVYTVPVLKIGPGEILSETMPDALERYHGYVSEGTYHLRARVTVGFYNESDVYIREDYPDQLWVEARGGLPQLDLISNWLAVRISKDGRVAERAGERKPKEGEGGVHGLITLLIGIIVGASGLGLLLLLRKKVCSGGK